MEFARRLVRPAAFVRIGTDPVARAWSGFGRFRLPADDAVDAGGQPYLGCGWIAGLPALQGVGGDQARRVTFTLNGVSPRIRELVEQSDCIGARFDLGILHLDTRRQAAGPMRWRGRGVVETIGSGLDDTGSGPLASTTHSDSVSLSVVFGDGGRRTAIGGQWTAQRWRMDHPDDAGCDNTPNLGDDASWLWPPR